MRFDDQYGDVLAIARVDPRAKIFIELAGLSPYDYIPRVKTTSRVHITAGGIRHDLLEQAQTLSEEQLQNIEGSFRLSEELLTKALQLQQGILHFTRQEPVAVDDVGTI